MRDEIIELKDAVIRFARCCDTCGFGIKILGVMIFCKKWGRELLPNQVCRLHEFAKVV